MFAKSSAFVALSASLLATACATILGSGAVLAQSPPPRPPLLGVKPQQAPPAARPQIAANQTEASVMADLMPVLHARQNGVVRCQAQVGEMATRAIDTTAYSALSTWSTTKPDQHQFQTVVVLRYPKAPTAPNAAAIITATPGGEGGCDSALVQIYPSTNTCKVLADGLTARGYTPVGDLTGLTVYQNTAKQRAMLLVSGKQCVIVAFQSVLSAN